jgi:hypothetical protein
MKVTLKKIISPFLLIMCSLAMQPCNARDAKEVFPPLSINEIELAGYSAICQKAIIALDHEVDFFNQKFGPIKSTNVVRKYKIDSSPNSFGMVVKVTYKMASLLYSSDGQKTLIEEINLQSFDAWQMLGFYEQTTEEILRSYGIPDRQTTQLLQYACEGWSLLFKLKNGRVFNMEIDLTYSE